MAAFPAGLILLLPEYGEQAESALERTPMESGPPKQAQVRSRVMVQVSGRILFTSAAQYASFRTWFRVDIKNGADWFDWTDPRTGTLRQARFVAGRERGRTTDYRGTLDLTELPITLEYWDA
jgi:hypothetical protein